jgi:hypothetical protein
MANDVPLKLLIPKGSDVRFDQGALGVKGAWYHHEGTPELPEGVVVTIDASALEAIAPHPMDSKPREPSWLWRRMFPDG